MNAGAMLLGGISVVCMFAALEAARREMAGWIPLVLVADAVLALLTAAVVVVST